MAFFAPGHRRGIAVAVLIGCVCGGALWLAGWALAVIVWRLVGG